MSYTESDLDAIVEIQIDETLRSGTIIRSVHGWKRECRDRMLENERQRPGYIETLTLALAAKAQGRRLTYCAESRGTHAISYVWSATGTCEPPSWWNRDEAKAEHDRRSA